MSVLEVVSPNPNNDKEEVWHMSNRAATQKGQAITEGHHWQSTRWYSDPQVVTRAGSNNKQSTENEVFSPLRLFTDREEQKATLNTLKNFGICFSTDSIFKLVKQIASDKDISSSKFFEKIKDDIPGSLEALFTKWNLLIKAGFKNYDDLDKLLQDRNEG